jgi:hypothetical protein
MPSPGLDAGPHLPCDVEAVLAAKCRRCHGSPTMQGAPFSLFTQADFLAPYAGSTVEARAVLALESDFMPLNGPPLSAADKAVMIGWLDAGVPLSTATCP